jgi:DNA-binding NtrC family response regulator
MDIGLVHEARMTESPDEGISAFGHLRTRAPAMRNVVTVLERLACTDITVTLIGETGTGKDVLAHALHAHSERAQAPFVILDCGAVPPNLAESELLGHERGAFTGAVSTHPGAFERAHGGTLFIDEAGELPLELQTRLLRVLESRRVRRVGGTQDRPVDVRVLAATNRELDSEVRSGRFRQDLYFRLAAAVVRIPPLRDRREDIPLLVSDLLADLGRREVKVAGEALALLQSRRWPGNVRELKNALACALAFVDGDRLELESLQFLADTLDRSPLDAIPLAGISLEQLEKSAIKQTLARANGNKVQAAKTLGIAVSTLYEKLKRYAIE